MNIEYSQTHRRQDLAKDTTHAIPSLGYSLDHQKKPLSGRVERMSKCRHDLTINRQTGSLTNRPVFFQIFFDGVL